MFERAGNRVCCGVNHASVLLATLGKLAKCLRFVLAAGSSLIFAELMFLLAFVMQAMWSATKLVRSQAIM